MRFELVENHLHTGQDGHRSALAQAEACRAFTDQFVGGESAQELIQLGDSGVEPIEDLGEVWIFGRIDAVGLELDQPVRSVRTSRRPRRRDAAEFLVPTTPRLPAVAVTKAEAVRPRWIVAVS